MEDAYWPTALITLAIVILVIIFFIMVFLLPFFVYSIKKQVTDMNKKLSSVIQLLFDLQNPPQTQTTEKNEIEKISEDQFL